MAASLAFIGLQLGIHVAFSVGVGRLLRLPVRSILIASNANVGGPATAAGRHAGAVETLDLGRELDPTAAVHPMSAAMAVSRGWSDLLQPAVLTGCLGYSIGTAAGLTAGKLMGFV